MEKHYDRLRLGLDIIVLAVCALCFGGILVLSIKNLNRFDRS